MLAWRPPRLVRPPKPSSVAGAGAGERSPSLLAQDTFRVGAALPSSTPAEHSRRFLPLGSCLQPPHPKAAPGGELVGSAILSSGPGTCVWVSLEDKF